MEGSSTGLDAITGTHSRADSRNLLDSTVHTFATVTYTGVTEYKVASILPPLNAIPREPGVLEKIVGSVQRGEMGAGVVLRGTDRG